MTGLGLGDAPLSAVLAAFAAAAAAIAAAGVALSAMADRLADRTGLGEAVTGAVFLGASTSLAGAVASVTAAWEELPRLAVSNALGGIAAQTAFLGLADLAYRGVNLEHAAASAENLMEGTLLVLLLGIAVVGMTTPEGTVAGVHPVSIALPLVYAGGVRWIGESRAQPMWGPRRTPETRPDVPEEQISRRAARGLWLGFAALAAVVAVSGAVVADAGGRIVERGGLSETFVGGLATALATSLPELITTVAAVRRGALTLAVGGILGGNAFDVLFLALSDAAYRPGSIYSRVGEGELFLVGVTVAMTAVLLLGLLRREKHGPANIGAESAAVLVLWIAAVARLAWSG